MYSTMVIICETQTEEKKKQNKEREPKSMDTFVTALHTTVRYWALKCPEKNTEL